MRSTIYRIGEKNINNFGSEMIIINSYMEFNNKDKRNYTYIDVYFPEYDWIYKRATYGNFKKGNIKCPYEKSIYRVGYLSEGEYKTRENGKKTRVYYTWHSMMERCYSDKYHKKHSTYKDCNVSEEFHNFQNFGSWDSENFYTVEGERMELDKDVLVKGNKIYSPDTCIYVPQTINTLFVKKDRNRGESAIGTTRRKNGKYVAQCNLINPETCKSKLKNLGYYDTELEAFEVYKYYKEKNIKEVADYYKDKIPSKLYQAMYKYEVDIND